VSSIKALSPAVRIGNAFVSYIAYICKMIWPINLAVLYPHPEGVILWQVLGSVLLLIAITAAVFWMVKRYPYLATGWFWYLGTLVPVIGIVQVGIQGMADRYTYIPLIGLFIIVAWGVPDLLKKWHHRKEILLALSALSILCFSIITWTQVGYWQNSIALFDHTLKVTDHNWLISNNRGIANNILGHYSQAIKDFDRAIEIKPDYAEAYYNRGLSYKGLGNYSQTIEDYSRAIQINTRLAEAYNNRGNAYGVLGYYSQAIKDFDRAIEIKPAYVEAFMNRGNAYNGLGNYRQAIEDYGRAIKINPDYAMAYLNRSIAYIRFGNNNLAVNDLKVAARLGYEPAKNLLKSQGISW
jgi:tetratricopeptide (TPR) repeat protein